VDLLGWLYPLEWVVANIMVLVHHALTFLGMDAESGLTWALSIVGLTILVRTALIPIFVRQIKAQRGMQLIAPELRAVQEKYKGKKDQASREAMTRETMELYSKHKTNPFSSCLPMLLQMPIFFALFRVLNYSLRDGGDPIGLLSNDLRVQANQARLFGSAPLHETFIGTEITSVRVIAAILIVMMVATQFFVQRQLTMKNMPASALQGPMAQQQKMLMYAMPFIFVLSGPNFPIGVLIYWTVTNLWSMGQQFYVIKRNPTPGSEAERLLKERQAAKFAAKGLAPDGRTLEQARLDEEAAALAAEEERKARQRAQPKSKKRAKKSGGAGGAAAGSAGGSAGGNPANQGSSTQRSNSADDAPGIESL